MDGRQTVCPEKRSYGQLRFQSAHYRQCTLPAMAGLEEYIAVLASMEMRRVGSEYFHGICPSCSVMRGTKLNPCSLGCLLSRSFPGTVNRSVSLLRYLLVVDLFCFRSLPPSKASELQPFGGLRTSSRCTRLPPSFHSRPSMCEPVHATLTTNGSELQNVNRICNTIRRLPADFESAVPSSLPLFTAISLQVVRLPRIADKARVVRRSLEFRR
jgi:hypothetical protein